VKKYIFTLCSVITVLLILVLTNDGYNSLYAHASGAQAGYTGSPGDGRNCTSCHAGTATSQNGLITSTIPVTGYVPGSVYTITASIVSAGTVKFGFEVSPQNTAGSKKGTMTVTSSSQTQLVGSGKYITHTLSGTAAVTGSKTWTFNWTAPFAGSGDLTFYGAFNASNNNGTNDGDQIILSQMLVHENLATGFHESLAEAFIKVYPNPASSWLNIVPIKGAVNLVRVFDLDGKKVLENSIENAGTVNLNIQSLEAGVYILILDTEEKTVTEKIVVL